MSYKKTKIAVVDSKTWYNKAAKIYKTFHQGLASYDKWLFQRFLPRDLQSKIILDVWSGDARMHSYFADKWIEKYIGFDIADELLKRAPSRVHRVIGDIEETRPFPNKSVDIILCFFVVLHIRDIKHLFEEAHRVLKDGGTMVVLHNAQRRSFIYTLPSDTFKIEDYHRRDSDVEEAASSAWFSIDSIILEEDSTHIATLYNMKT